MDQLGGYRIVRKIGEGGMGAVYEAVQESLSRRVAVKVLHPQLAAVPEVTSRFFNEARAVNIVQHPGVVAIFEYGAAPDGAPYIVMEYLEGEALAGRLDACPRPPGALSIARQVAAALAAAHRKGIVHRDLKPANIMLVPDPEVPGGVRAKVLDFGVAKLGGAGGEEGDSLRTRTGVLLGTPLYMSPEQCRSANAVNDRSDVYALGVIIYQMLAGRPPFAAGGLGEVMAQHLYGTPQPLGEVDADIPKVVAELVDQMLAKEPAARPSMEQVVTALGAFGPLSLGPVSPVPVPHERSAPSLTFAATLARATGDSAQSLAAGQVAPNPAPRRRALHRLLAVAGAAAVILALVALRRPPPVHTTAPVARTRLVHWQLSTVPAAAEVIRASDGAVLGLTPFRSDHAEAPGPVEIILRRAGFAERRLFLGGAQDQTMHLELAPLPAPAAPPPAARPEDNRGRQPARRRAPGRKEPSHDDEELEPFR